MSDPKDPSYLYQMTIKLFGSQPEPPFEDPGELEAVWGRAWGVDNDVGADARRAHAPAGRGDGRGRPVQAHPGDRHLRRPRGRLVLAEQ